RVHQRDRIQEARRGIFRGGKVLDLRGGRGKVRARWGSAECHRQEIQRARSEATRPRLSGLSLGREEEGGKREAGSAGSAWHYKPPMLERPWYCLRFPLPAPRFPQLS